MCLFIITIIVINFIFGIYKFFPELNKRLTKYKVMLMFDELTLIRGKLNFKKKFNLYLILFKNFV
jgi:hypothetical protein